MKPALFILLLCGLFVSCHQQSLVENKLPTEVATALHTPGKVILFSLEPSPMYVSDNTNMLQGYTILGQTNLEGPQAATAVAAFESAIPLRTSDVWVSCFVPRHALRTTFQGHTYDFLLCYQCGAMDVYRDDTNFTEVHASGSSAVLNGLLTAAKIPLATPPPSARK